MKTNNDCAADIFGSSKWVASPYKYEFDNSSDTVSVYYLAWPPAKGKYLFAEECNKLTLSDLSGANSTTYTVQTLSVDQIKWTDQNNSVIFLTRE